MRRTMDLLKDSDKEILTIAALRRPVVRRGGAGAGITENAATVRYVRALKRLKALLGRCRTAGGTASMTRIAITSTLAEQAAVVDFLHEHAQRRRTWLFPTRFQLVPDSCASDGAVGICLCSRRNATGVRNDESRKSAPEGSPIGVVGHQVEEVVVPGDEVLGRQPPGPG